MGIYAGIELRRDRQNHCASSRPISQKETKKNRIEISQRQQLHLLLYHFLLSNGLPTLPQRITPASYGDKHYTAKGKEVKLGDQCAYVVGDPKWKSAVIVCHDVFGPNKGTHHQLCDALAAGGHYVIMPDFFNGGSIEPY